MFLKLLRFDHDVSHGGRVIARQLVNDPPQDWTANQVQQGTEQITFVVDARNDQIVAFFLR